MVVKQKEELHDLEARLKTEIKTREDHLVEVIGSFFSGQRVGKTEIGVSATQDVAKHAKNNPVKKRKKKSKTATQFVEKTNEKHENLTETDGESIGISGTAAESQPQDTKSRITSDAFSRKEQQGEERNLSREESSQRTDTIANDASKAGENVPIGAKKGLSFPLGNPISKMTGPPCLHLQALSLSHKSNTGKHRN